MLEADLCADFKAAVEHCGWTVYPETAGWDLLLVGPEGVQVGVEAKLRGNVDVLAQAVGLIGWPDPHHKGPDYHAVLVPKASERFCVIARHLHILVFTPRKIGDVYFQLQLNSLTNIHDPLCWSHHRPCWTPPVPIDVPAGVPSPSSISPWKVAAVRLCLRLDQRGFVTSHDFTELKLNFSPMWRRDWLRSWGRIKVPNGKGGTVTLMRYVRRPGAKLPSEQFPEIATALEFYEADKAAA